MGHAEERKVKKERVSSPDNCDDLHASDASANGAEVVATREKGRMIRWEEKGPRGNAGERGLGP